ncbi:MAG: protein-L-isoaspartate O-methyltransferase [Rhizobiales bacterium PAR1]|nr:MAG: protein-L-isoaspartate O-methyltransferase [Rhizobiales bacterium PAR1]
MVDMSTARRVMVDNQIRTFDVTDREVLAAFDVVPRDAFVAPGDKAIAYADRVLSVGEGNARRAMLPPLILARLIQALQPVAGERALDVAGGLGYSAAILAAIGLDTTAVEADAGLTEGARAALVAAGAKVTMAAAQPGLSANAGANLPGEGFDIILINGATECEPKGFFPLLKENGRLGVLFSDGRSARALVYVKANGNVSPRRAFDAQAPVLPGFAKEAGFVF